MQRQALISAVLLLTAASLGCGGGTTTGDGECVADIGSGDLVITEIYGNSPGADEGNEWFEIYNASSTSLNLSGMLLVKTDDEGGARKEHLMKEVVIEPGQYLVVGGILERFKFEYIDYGYGADLGAMSNSAGRLLLQCGNTIIDEVNYVDLPEGESMQLSGLVNPPDAIENDDFSNFCVGREFSFFQDQIGTPKAANEICAPLTQDDCIDGMTERSVVKAQAGDVVVSEFMANPDAVPDDVGEWIELRINANIDLNGLQLGRAEADTGAGEVRDTIAAVECLPASPGDYVVLAISTDAGENGGVEADFPLGFSLPNSDDGVYVGIGGAVLDTVLYSSTGTGVASVIDADGEGPCPATQPYGDGDLGTPGAANPEDCPTEVPDGMCIDPDTEMLRAIVYPTTLGDVVINEWMPDPAGADANKEWIELRSTGTFDLNETTIEIVGKTTFDVRPAECIEMVDGTLVVLASSGDSGLNAGIPQVDFVDSSIEFFNDSADRVINVSAGATVLDTVTLSAGEIADPDQGESVVVDGTKLCKADDSTPPPADYGTDANAGTPGATNGTCP